VVQFRRSGLLYSEIASTVSTGRLHSQTDGVPRGRAPASGRGRRPAGPAVRVRAARPGPGQKGSIKTGGGRQLAIAVLHTSAMHRSTAAPNLSPDTTGRPWQGPVARDAEEGSAYRQVWPTWNSHYADLGASRREADTPSPLLLSPRSEASLREAADLAGDARNPGLDRLSGASGPAAWFSSCDLTSALRRDLFAPLGVEDDDQWSTPQSLPSLARTERDDASAASPVPSSLTTPASPLERSSAYAPVAFRSLAAEWAAEKSCAPPAPADSAPPAAAWRPRPLFSFDPAEPCLFRPVAGASTVLALSANESAPFGCAWRRRATRRVRAKLLVCPMDGCSHRSATKHALVSHIRLHTGEKPYKCSDAACGALFKDWSGCATHIRRHHPELFAAFAKLSGRSARTPLRGKAFELAGSVLAEARRSAAAECGNSTACVATK
jgi:hypothetical protein